MKKNYLVCLTLAVIVLSFFLILNFRLENAIYQFDNSRAITPGKSNKFKEATEEYSIYMKKNGLYTNDKYNFRFEYPSDKFTRTYTDESGASWQAKPADDRFIIMTVSDRPNIDDWIDLYESLYALKVGQKLAHRFGTSTKLNSREQEGYKMVAIFTTSDPQLETEATVSYSAIWFAKHKPIIFLDFSAEPEHKNYLISHKKIFDEIVQSFEFFD